MPTKNVSIQVLIRDPETNEVISGQNAIGTTEDEGVTVTIGHGYVTEITNVPLTDVLRTLVPPPVDLPAPAGLSRVNDAEANIDVLTFS